MRSRMSILMAMLCLVGIPGATAPAAPGDDAGKFPWEGEVAGMGVYVRSGPGINYYPTTKMDAGDRVLVLAERFGWYQIVPPAGSFSYVDMTQVTRSPGAKTGTVNQPRVYVRAGGEYGKRKTSTQLVLDRGATVEILGNVDGFYKIVPPRRASLYISKQYVEFVPPRLRTGLVRRYLRGEEMLDAAASPERETAPGAADDTLRLDDASAAPPATVDGDEDRPPLKVDSALARRVESDQTSPPGRDAAARPDVAAIRPAEAKAGSTGRYDALLEVVEGDLRAMLQRPMAEQDLGPLRGRYEEIAAKTEERVPAEIARIRIRQLDDLAEHRAARTKILENVEALDDFRSRMSAERMKILRARMERTLEEFDLEGELRQSYAFAPEKRRYRLVDPEAKTTIAYVDIPRSVHADVRRLIGRVVGVRTAHKEFSPAARVPIAVAASITDLSARPASESVIKTGRGSNTGNMQAGLSKSTEGPARPAERRISSPKPVVAAGQDPEKEE